MAPHPLLGFCLSCWPGIVTLPYKPVSTLAVGLGPLQPAQPNSPYSYQNRCSVCMLLLARMAEIRFRLWTRANKDHTHACRYVMLSTHESISLWA